MSDSLKQYLWQRAKPILGYDSNIWRLDFAGRTIRWNDYGNRNSSYGWEFGHIVAKADGGSDFYTNLQAEHWQTNMDKERARLVKDSIKGRAALLGSINHQVFPSPFLGLLSMNRTKKP